MNFYRDAMGRYATFSGRSTRSQYWLFALFLFVLMIIGAVIDASLGFPDANGTMPVTGVIWIVHMIPYLAVTARRFHDSGKSGWWLLTVLVPPVGAVVCLVFACLSSTPGDNRFGPHPRLAAGTRASEALTGAGGPSATGRAPASADPVHELERLAALKASGAIDDAEYQAMKSRLLQERV